MRSRDIKIDIPKTSNPFKLGQYILKLLDVIKGLRKDLKSLNRINEKLRAENEELKKKLD